MKTYNEFLAESEVNTLTEATKQQIIDLMNTKDWKENEAVAFGIAAQVKGLVRNASTGAKAFQKHYDEWKSAKGFKPLEKKKAAKPSGLAYRPKR